MEPLRVAVVGTGGMGQGHVRILREIQEVELVAVCDIDEPTARRVAEENEVDCYLDHRELLEEEELDAVTIATPHPVHPVVAIDAAQAGVHVFTEKPMASRLSDADAMVRAAERADVKLGVMFQQRTVARNIKAKEIIDSGALGDIYRVELLASGYRSQAYYDSGAWRATWCGEGGGVLYNQAPHSLDIFQWLVGLPSRLIARASTHIHDIECEDMATAVLEFPNGAHGVIHASTAELPGENRIEVCGDEGKLVIAGSLRLARCSQSIREFTHATDEAWGKLEATWEDVEVPEAESGHKVCLCDFTRAILDDRDPLVPGADGVRSLELACAMTLSSHRGKWVDIPVDRAEYDALLAELCAQQQPTRRQPRARAARTRPRRAAAAKKKQTRKVAAKKAAKTTKKASRTR